ncbi:uncharacterized protein [Aegilops tauschii subsp. strangulata]|uniref:uncharacterized protein n=1 Tax=Aegilops tauschii subsp. strangulata TaxID=200361 RepID=UPI001ABC4A92|nr:uncharacterized protein LOC120964951 [Aegilops tauschii subsp. strangulata]
MDQAPQDVLAEVLRRLAPRSLAACRCVCKGWRAVVDANRLLRADLLPLTVDGIFYETCPYNIPMLFSSPATGRRVTGKLDYLDWPLNDVFPIMDCCNGLLLMCDHVVNPATRQWVRLPPLPPSCTAAGCTRCSNENRYLAYDPALSPHYEVFLIPNIPFKLPTGHICMHICDDDDESVSAMEWPPSPYIVHVFSSKTGCWKERPLLREGEAAGTVADVKAVYHTVSFFLYAAYWKDALYVRCEEEFLMRINLLHDGNKGYTVPRIGKSEKGVYCAFGVDRNTFQIWFLDESHGQMEWALRNVIDLQRVVEIYPANHVDGPYWVVQSEDQMDLVLKNGINLQPAHDNDKAMTEGDFDWDTDNEYVVSTDDWDDKGGYRDYFYCLGFHPYKEVVFFHGAFRTVAYNLIPAKFYTWVR